MAEDFHAFFERRRRAADAYARGDGGLLDAILPMAGSASFHSPGGDTVIGAAEVARRYGKDAASFGPGGKSELEVLQMEAGESLGFWTGFQIATVNLSGRSDPVHMRIRVTEVFRRAGGSWKLIHRHADFPAKS